MAPVFNICFIAALFVGQSAAHFYLNFPPTIGFDDQLESSAPCGSFTPDFSKDNVTDYYVGGNAVALTSIHPQATWLFRATLDTTASGNWTTLLPAVEQTGLGNFCEQSVAVPASFAGKKGILGIVQDAPDGVLYQCAAVNFVAGTAPSTPSVCNNGTGLSATFTQDAVLSTLPASASSTGGSSATATSSTSTTASSSTSSKSASPRTFSPSYGFLGSLVWVGIVGCATSVVFLL